MKSWGRTSPQRTLRKRRRKERRDEKRGEVFTTEDTEDTEKKAEENGKREERREKCVNVSIIQLIFTLSVFDFSFLCLFLCALCVLCGENLPINHPSVVQFPEFTPCPITPQNY